MEVVLIAAMAENRVIGRDGGMPWHLPRDLAHFKAVTMGHDLIMGRRTWESIGSRPLPGRRAIVMTRNRGFGADGAEIASDVETALDLVQTEVAYVVGGGAIYRAFLDRADRLELTVVHARPEGDTTFPEFDPADWRLVTDRPEPADDRHAHAMSFRRYERIR